MNTNKTGKLIAEIRKSKNMTQEMLAEKMGVSINAVSKWERGLSFPDVSLYKSLCDELEISIEELINGEIDSSNEAKTKAIINTALLNEKSIKRMHLIEALAFMIIIILTIACVIIFNFLSNKYEDNINDYYNRNYKESLVGRNVEMFLKYRNGGKFPDYYGGMYISDDAYNLIVLIVKDKIPEKGTLEYSYYYELLNTIDESIEIKYVKNSYNDLEYVFNVINDYMMNNEVPEEFNAVGIDVMKNKVVVNYREIYERDKKEFKEKIIDSDLVEFERALDNVDDSKKCKNYHDEIGDEILDNHGELLVNIQSGSKGDILVSLNVYDDGTYELYTAYQACKAGRICNSILIYTKSVKGKYNYDIDKILEKSTNANNKSYSMDNLPEYEIYLGEKYINKYDSLMFTVEKGRKNMYLTEFLNSIKVDLSKCAKPEY